MHVPRLTAIACVLLGPLAARAQARPVCPPPARSHSRVVVMPAASPRDSLVLRVRRLDTGDPLPAEARLNAHSWHRTASTGTLVLALPGTRHVQLEVRALGFGLARLAYRPARDSSVIAMAVMAPTTLYFDEFCR